MGSSDEFDWYADETEKCIAEAATRHNITAATLERHLEAYIPDAETPRESIERVASTVANGQ